MALPSEAVFLRPAERCDVHDWPTDGMGRRLVEEMRARHGSGGVNACVSCIERAREDAGTSVERGPRRVYVRVDFDRALLNVEAAGERTRAWLETPAARLVLSAFLASVRDAKWTKDPEPRRPLPPPGYVWPSLAASTLERRLREAFPGEEVTVRTYRSPWP